MSQQLSKLGFAYTLWAAFGIFGAHRFYLGYWISGAIQFSLVVVGASMFFPEVIEALKGNVTVKALVGDLIMMSGILWALADGYFIWRFAKPSTSQE